MWLLSKDNPLIMSKLSSSSNGAADQQARFLARLRPGAG